MISARDPAKGYEHRRAPQRIAQDGFRKLRNADLYAPGVVSRADGYRATLSETIDEGALPIPGNLDGVGYRGTELVRLQDQDLYSYVEPEDRWVRRGPWPLVVTHEDTAVTRPTSIRTAGAAELAGYRLTVWQEVNASNQYSIYLDVRAVDGGHITRIAIVTNSALPHIQPRAVSCGNWIAVTFWVFGGDPDALHIRRWQPDKPGSLSGAITLPTARGYDLLGVADREELWVARLVPGVQLTEVRPDLTINRDRAVPGYPGAYTALALDRIAATAEILLAAVAAGIAGIARWLLDDLTSIASYPLIQSVRVTCAIRTTLDGTVAVENDVIPQIEVLNVFRSGVSIPPIAPVHRAYGLGLAGRALVWGDDVLILGILPDGLINGTSFATSISSYFVFRARDLSIVARAWPLGQATTYGGRFTLEEFHLGAPVVHASGADWTVTVRTAFREPDTAGRAPTGYEQLGAEVIGTLSLDFTSARGKLEESHGLAVWPRGGFLSGYDGRRTFEVDFHLPPNIDEFDPNIGTLAPNEIEPGDYAYAVTYLWRDENGRRYRSMVATGNVTVPGVAPAGIVDVFVRTIRQTERDDIQIELWRTTKAGTVTASTFFLVSNPAVPTMNSLTAGQVTIRDSLPDAQIVDNEQLLLEPAGPLLAHDIVQVSGFVARSGERLWSRSTARGSRLFASLLADDADGPAMSSLLRVDLDTTAEALALAGQDGSQFVGTETGIHVFGGRGLDNAGAGQAFGLPVAIPSTEGCSLLGGMVRTGAGIVYASDDGPALVARDQTISALTDGVRELYHDTEAAIADIAWNPRAAELWLPSTDPAHPSLACNLDTFRWSQYDQLLTRSVAISQAGVMAIARTDGIVLVRTADDVRVAGVELPLVVSPGWQRPSGVLLAPYSLAAIGLVLLYHAPHRLTVELYFDDDDDDVRATTTIDPDRDGLRTAAGWGDLATWGLDGVPWGALDGWAGSAYYVKLQVNSPLIRSATIRVADDGAPVRTWSLVQTIWAWTQRQVTDGFDEGDPKGRRKYRLSVV